jgi:hypothetical protein
MLSFGSDEGSLSDNADIDALRASFFASRRQSAKVPPVKQVAPIERAISAIDSAIRGLSTTSGPASPGNGQANGQKVFFSSRDVVDDSLFCCVDPVSRPREPAPQEASFFSTDTSIHANSLMKTPCSTQKDYPKSPQLMTRPSPHALKPPSPSPRFPTPRLQTLSVLPRSPAAAKPPQSRLHALWKGYIVRRRFRSAAVAKVLKEIRDIDDSYHPYPPLPQLLAPSTLIRVRLRTLPPDLGYSDEASTIERLMREQLQSVPPPPPPAPSNVEVHPRRGRVATA